MPPPDSAGAFVPDVRAQLSPLSAPSPTPSSLLIPPMRLCLFSPFLQHSLASYYLLCVVFFFKLGSHSCFAHDLVRPFNVTSWSCLCLKDNLLVEAKILEDFGMLLPPPSRLSYLLSGLSILTEELFLS